MSCSYIQGATLTYQLVRTQGLGNRLALSLINPRRACAARVTVGRQWIGGDLERSTWRLSRAFFFVESKIMRLPVRSLVSLLSDWTKQASLNSYIVPSRPPSMDLLAKYGVNPGMPKMEFVHHLNVHSNDSLKKLREALFKQACEAELYPRECQGLPLVSRRDTAIRPAASVLSEDSWVIMHCVENNVLLPRTVFKNGKRSKSFVADARRPQSQSESSQCLNQPLPLSSDQLTLETLLQTTQTTTQITMQTTPQPQSPSISQYFNQSLSQSSENQSFIFCSAYTIYDSVNS